MKYRKGYDYQLAEMETFQTDFNPPKDIVTEFITLTTSGELIIKSGYAWDGASGPTIDTKSSMRGSLAHDALYQLIRNGHLPNSLRNQADDFFYKCLIKDKMFKWRAMIWRREVKKYAGFAADPKSIKKVYEAP